MCHDLSFSADTVEFITDLLPNIIWDNQLNIDFAATGHILSMTSPKAIAIYYKDGVPHADEFSWRVIFSFMNTPEKITQYRPRYANTRVESIWDTKLPWYGIRKQRCLIAVNGIMEHREVKGFKNKIPYLIKLACSSHILLPALYNYSPIGDPETGEIMGTYSILTEPANDVMKNIHNSGENKHRMPLFMEPKRALRWIQDDLTDEQIKEFTSYQIPSENLDYWPIWTIRTPKERPDGKGKIERFDWPNLPDLGNDELAIQSALF